jgi:hypothetical protein
MSTKLDAMLSEVSSLVASATAVSAKKKPQHAVEKDSKGKFRIRSMKDGKLWPQTYDTKEKANKGLAAYHLRKKGVPPKKTKAAAECPECGAEAKIDMRGMHCPECGYDDHDAELHNRIQDGDEEVVQVCWTRPCRLQPSALSAALTTRARPATTAAAVLALPL